MTIEQTIQKAIEGGWRNFRNAKYFVYKHAMPPFSTLEGIAMQDKLVQKMVEQTAMLDPLFWQALGKALGWTLVLDMDSGGKWEAEYLVRWHQLIDHLAPPKNGTIESYFEQL